MPSKNKKKKTGAAAAPAAASAAPPAAGASGAADPADPSDDEELPELEAVSSGDDEPTAAAVAAPPVPTLSAEELKNSGNEKYKGKDYEGAIRDYTAAIEADPQAAYYGNRAAAHLMRFDYRRAADDCTQALSMDPAYLRGYLRLGKALLSMGDFDEAITAYHGALRHDPTNGTALTEKDQARNGKQLAERARELMTSKRYRQALVAVARALEVAPGSRPLQHMRTEAMIANGDYDAAYKLLTEMMRGGAQTDSELLFQRARCLYYQGNFPSSIKHLQQALRSDPDNNKCMVEIKKMRRLEALKKQGNDAFAARQWQGAIDSYTECLQVDPANKDFNSKLYCNRATARSKLRQYAEGAADAQSAIDLNPDYSKAYLRKAACLEALGGVEHLEEACRIYEGQLQRVGRRGEGARELQGSLRDAKMKLKRAKRKNYYTILNVSEDASEDQIRRAYKKMALKWHPDRHANKTDAEKKVAETQFQEIGEANEVLSDPEKKRRYDAGADLDELDGPGGGSPFGGGVDPSDLFSAFFGGGGGGFHGGHGHGGGFGGFR